MMSLLHPAMTAFLAVAKHGTVHGAAREIGLSQTGVTQRIRGLERDLGCTLFVRSRKGMRPTAEGEALLRYGQRATDLEGELLALIRRGADVADVRIAITGPSSLMRSRVIPGVTRALTRFPGLALTFHLDDRDAALNQLKAGAAQLAVLARDDVVTELDAKRLRPDRLLLVGPAAWAGRALPAIVSDERIIDFDASDDATFSFLRGHGLLADVRRRRHLVNNPDALASLVAAGLGYSVLSADVAAPLLAEGRLIDLCPGRHLDREVALAWYPRHEMPAYFQALIDAVD